jgi:hypothetical protein
MSGSVGFPEVLQDFGRLIAALGEYRGVAVLTGGFVPYVYRHMDRFSRPSLPYLLTTDVDWTVPARLPLLGGQPLGARLADSGFVVIQSTDTSPAVQRYQHQRFGNRDLAPIYGEFLVPLTGGASRRGTDRRVQVVQEGLTAQALRYLDLLLEEPMEFDASTLDGLGLDRPHVIRVSRPAAYVLQKLLSWDERAAGKKDKDAAYLHEVAILTNGAWSGIDADVRRTEASTHERRRWVSKARKRMHDLFLSTDAEGPLRVVRQYERLADPGSRPTEDGVRRLMTRFADESGLGGSTR